MSTDLYYIPAMLDRYVEALNSGKTKFDLHIEDRQAGRDETSFHCSDAMKDPRMRIFKRIGAPHEPMKVISLRRFLLGDCVESIARQAVSWNLANIPDYKGWEVIFQGRVEFPEWETRGSYDILLKTPGGNCLMDIKSCHSWKIDYVKRGEHDMGYLGQLTSYKMGVMKQGTPVHQTVVVYIDKDTMRTFPDFVPRGFEDLVVQDYAKLMKYWGEYKKDKTVPPELAFTETKKKGLAPQWTCDPRYCNWWKLCPTIKSYWDQHPQEE